MSSSSVCLPRIPFHVKQRISPQIYLELDGLMVTCPLSAVGGALQGASLKHQGS